MSKLHQRPFSRTQTPSRARTRAHTRTNGNTAGRCSAALALTGKSRPNRILVFDAARPLETCHKQQQQQHETCLQATSCHGRRQQHCLRLGAHCQNCRCEKAQLCATVCQLFARHALRDCLKAEAMSSVESGSCRREGTGQRCGTVERCTTTISCCINFSSASAARCIRCLFSSVAGEWAFTRNVARSRNWHFVSEAAGAAAHLWPLSEEEKTG